MINILERIGGMIDSSGLNSEQAQRLKVSLTANLANIGDHLPHVPRKARGVYAVMGLGTLGILVSACGNTGQQPTAEVRPTKTLQIPFEVSTPTEKIVTPIPTETVAPAATPTSVIEMGVSEMGVGGEGNDILKSADSINRLPVYEENFKKKNPGAKLLVPEGSQEQAFVQFIKDGKTIILGNFNLPVYPDTATSKAAFNAPDRVWLMSWVDDEENWLYHIPLQPGQEGKAPVVFQRDGKLFEGLVDLATGQIETKTEKPFWQEMPSGAVKAVMAKFQRAVFVTFWDKNGQQLEGERVRVCDLPAEATPTLEVAKPMELAGFQAVWNPSRGKERWEYQDADKVVIAFWNKGANEGKGRVELAEGITSLDFAKHRGLFVGQAVEQTEKITRERIKQGEIVIPIPFEIGDSGRVDSKTSLRPVLCFKDVTVGTELKAPFGGKLERFGMTDGKGIELTSTDLVIDFVIAKVTDIPALPPSIAAGDSLFQIGLATLPKDFGFLGEAYQVSIAEKNPNDTLKKRGLSFENILRDQDGRFVFIAASSSLTK